MGIYEKTCMAFCNFFLWVSWKLLSKLMPEILFSLTISCETSTSTMAHFMPSAIRTSCFSFIHLLMWAFIQCLRVAYIFASLWVREVIVCVFCTGGEGWEEVLHFCYSQQYRSVGRLGWAQGTLSSAIWEDVRWWLLRLFWVHDWNRCTKHSTWNFSAVGDLVITTLTCQLLPHFKKRLAHLFTVVMR